MKKVMARKHTFLWAMVTVLAAEPTNWNGLINETKRGWRYERNDENKNNS
jgi:hypothetical protein